MPRSGSTWLYNALRLLLTRYRCGAGKLACGWVDDLQGLPAAGDRLVKLHDYVPSLFASAHFVAYSYRDIRDALASLSRKFEQPPTLNGADHMVAQHWLWTARADYRMRYEHMVEHPERELQRLAHALMVAEVDLADLSRELAQLSYDTQGPSNEIYNELTLLHRNHFTDGRIGSWRSDLPQELEREVVSRHAAFFRAEHYPTDASAHGPKVNARERRNG